MQGSILEPWEHDLGCLTKTEPSRHPSKIVLKEQKNKLEIGTFDFSLAERRISLGLLGDRAILSLKGKMALLILV